MHDFESAQAASRKYWVRRVHSRLWSIAARSYIFSKHLTGNNQAGTQLIKLSSNISPATQDLSEEVAIATVHEAFKQGLNYFDTSPFCGEGLSEVVNTLTTYGAACVCMPTKSYLRISAAKYTIRAQSYMRC